MATAAPALTPDPEADAAKLARDNRACAAQWIAELTISEKAQADWLRMARKIARLYKKLDRANGQERGRRRFAMLWANTQTIQPAVYSRPPQAVVSRRFEDADPVARQASEVLERSLAFSIDKNDLDGRLGQVSLDYVLFARGQTWERYKPTHGPTVTPQIELQVVTVGDEGAVDGGYMDADGNAYDGEVKESDGKYYGQGEPYEPVIFEESVTDYVNWEDFGHSVARTWDEVDYVWRRVYLSRKQLIDRFGEDIGKRVPLDWGPKNRPGSTVDLELTNKAAVYEIWCKSDKKAYWISRSWSEAPLDERDDPLGLDDFFPCPRPLLGTTANDSAIPVPDYVFYQDQAEEIDKLTARIAVLQEAVKVRGFYAGDKKNDLNNLLNADTNIMIPVPDWVSLKESGGIAGNVEWFPIQQVVGALQALIAQRTQLISDVYQITGVSDIQRGESNPSETAAAQKIKATFGSLRIRDRQLDMQRFARDVLRIKGEVIAGKFSADTLKAMTGVKMPTNAEKQALELQLQQQAVLAQAQAMQAAQAQAATQPQPGIQAPPPAAGPPGAPTPGSAPLQPPAQPSPMMGHNGGPPMAPQPTPEQQEILDSPTWEDVETLLHDAASRTFRIDIETDSTLEPDETEEKARTTELLTALGNLVQQWGPAIVAQPAIAPMVGEMIKFALRRFRAGRQLEEVIDETIDKLVKDAANAPPPGAAAAPPPDQTPVQVAAINQQTEQITQAGETERAKIEAGTQAEENQIKATDQQIHLATLNGVAAQPPPQGAA